MKGKLIRVNGRLYESVDDGGFEGRIRDVFDDMATGQLVDAWNSYCEDRNAGDFEVHPMNDVSELLYDMDPLYILRMAHYGDFDPTHDYFWFDGYGNLASSDDPAKSDDSPIVVDDMVEYVVETGRDLGSTEIADAVEDFSDDAR